MSDFNTLCKKFENSDPAALKDIMTRKLNSVYDKLLALPEKEEAGDIFGRFCIVLMLADGVFSKEEFDLIQTKMDTAALTSMTYDEICDFIEETNLRDPEEAERIVKSMIGITKRLSDFDRDDIILISLMMCGIDKDISDSEKAILTRLMA